MNIPKEAYVRDAFEFTPSERHWMMSLMSWLPETIIDSHVHTNTAQHVRWIDARNRGHMLSTFPSFDLEESREVHTRFFPGKRVRALRFPQVFTGIDHRAASQYLLEQSDPDDRVALFGLPDDLAYTRRELATDRYRALKMYHAYFSPPATRISQYFPPEILDVAQALGIPIILHIPVILTKCLEDVRWLLRDFPNLTIVLAHLGLTKMVVPGLSDAYAEFSTHPRVFLDTSMVPDAEVVALAIKYFGFRRILFGSDEPIYLIRARMYEHPVLGQRLITRYPYHWVDPEERRQFNHLAEGLTHALWPCLQAIRSAIERLPLTEQKIAKQAIFHDNAVHCFHF